jgi:hypothetical protein
LDRLSGKLWRISGESKTLVIKPRADIKEELSTPALSQLELRMETKSIYSFLTGELYNGSSFKLSRIILRIWIYDSREKLIWVRDFDESVLAPPLENCQLAINRPQEEYASMKFSIVRAYGSKSNP